MKKILAVVLMLAIVLSLSACGCSHEWEDATCTSPKTCIKCNYSEGEPEDHDPDEWIFVEDSEGNMRPGIRTQLCKDCGEVVNTEPGLFYNEDGTCRNVPEFMEALEIAAENLTDEDGYCCGEIDIKPSATGEKHVYTFKKKGSNIPHAVVCAKYNNEFADEAGPINGGYVMTIVDKGDIDGINFFFSLSAALVYKVDPTLGDFDACKLLITKNGVNSEEPIVHNGLEYQTLVVQNSGKTYLMTSIDVPE